MTAAIHHYFPVSQRGSAAVFSNTKGKYYFLWEKSVLHKKPQMFRLTPICVSYAAHRFSSMAEE